MPRILVVDDEPACRDATQILLEARGYEVRTVADANEALRLAPDYKPDVAVIDWMLRNELDGVELAREIAREYPKIHCLVITGYPNPETIARSGLTKGRFLAKPVAPAELLAAIEAALDASRH